MYLLNEQHWDILVCFHQTIKRTPSPNLELKDFLDWMDWMGIVRGPKTQACSMSL